MDDFERNWLLLKDEVLKTDVCRSRPVSLFFLMTMRCNLDCIMCFQRDTRSGAPDFPAENFERLRPVLPFANMITWQGGEVFALNYFKDILGGLSTGFPRIRHHIITNGLLVGSEWMETFGRIKSYLVFSIDSPVKETYEGIRKGACFETLTANLKRLSTLASENGQCLYGVNAVVMKRNLHELRLFPAFCREYGMRHLRFGDLNSSTLSLEENVVMTGSAEEKRFLLETIREVGDECERSGIRFECVFKDLLESSAPDSAVPGNGGDSGERPRCVMPWTNLYVDNRGEVMPHCMCRVSVGNIFKKSFEEIWNGPVMREYRQRVREGKLEGFCSQRCVDGAVDRRVYRDAEELPE